MSIVISNEERQQMAERRNKGEVRAVPLRSLVMNQLLMSAGVDPVAFWHAHGTAMVEQGLKDLKERGGGPAFVRELLLQKIEEYKA